MSSSAIELNKENRITPLSNKLQDSSMTKMNTPRKSLQTLQYSAIGNRILVNKDRGTHQRDKRKSDSDVESVIKPISEQVSVFTDAPVLSPIAHVGGRCVRGSAGDVDGIDKEAYDLMINDSIPEEYWKELAEQRRIALEDSLLENEQLHQDIEDLREENSRLSEMASQSEYFASILESFIGSDEENNSKNDSANEEDDKADDIEDDNQETAAKTDSAENPDTSKTSTEEVQASSEETAADGTESAGDTAEGLGPTVDVDIEKLESNGDDTETDQPPSESDIVS